MMTTVQKISLISVKAPPHNATNCHNHRPKKNPNSKNPPRLLYPLDQLGLLLDSPPKQATLSPETVSKSPTPKKTLKNRQIFQHPSLTPLKNLSIFPLLHHLPLHHPFIILLSPPLIPLSHYLSSLILLLIPLNLLLIALTLPLCPLTLPLCPLTLPLRVPLNLCLNPLCLSAPKDCR